MVLPNPFMVVNGGVSLRREEGSTADARNEGESEKAPDLPGARPAEEAPERPEDALARYAAGLKISGMIRLNDQDEQIVINGVPRKEGDFVALDQDNTVIHLQVVHIMPGKIVVRLNELEQTVKF